MHHEDITQEIQLIQSVFAQLNRMANESTSAKDLQPIIQIVSERFNDLSCEIESTNYIAGRLINNQKAHQQ